MNEGVRAEQGGRHAIRMQSRLRETNVFALKLIVEVDGAHHQTDEGCDDDKRRDRYLAEQGYRLLRMRRPITGGHAAS